MSSLTLKEKIVFTNAALSDSSQTLPERIKLLPELAQALLGIRTSRHKFFKTSIAPVVNLLKAKAADDSEAEEVLRAVLAFGTMLVHDDTEAPANLKNTDELMHERDMLGSILFQLAGCCLAKHDTETGFRVLDETMGLLGCLRFQLVKLSKALDDSTFPSDPQPHWLRHGIAWFSFGILLSDHPMPLHLVYSPSFLYLTCRRLLAASLSSSVATLGDKAIGVLELLLPRLSKRLEGDDVKLLKAIPQHLMLCFDDDERKRIFGTIDTLVECLESDVDKLDCFSSLAMDPSVHPTVRSLVLLRCRDKIVQAATNLKNSNGSNVSLETNRSCFVSLRSRDFVTKVLRNSEGDDAEDKYWFGRIAVEVEVMISAGNILRFMMLSKHFDADVWGVRDQDWQSKLLHKCLQPMRKLLLDSATHRKPAAHNHDPNQSATMNQQILLTIVDHLTELVQQNQ